MSQDTENNDNGIGVPDVADQDDETDYVGIFVTPRQRPDDRVSNTVVSSQLSSVSSTSEASGLFSRETLPISRPAFLGVQESETIISLTKETEHFRLVALPGLENVRDGIDSLRNSTVSLLESSNTTLMQSSNTTLMESSNTTLMQSSNSTLMQSSNETLSSSWSSEEIGAVVIVSIMVPFILLSNIFVIISVVRFRRLHTPTNYFITSLAAVDIFIAVAIPFGIVVEVFNFGGAVGPEDVVLCLLPNRILMMACGVSVITLATIAYDRHTALVSPLEYINIMTPRKVAIMVSLTWVYSAVIVWLPLMAGWYDVPSDSEPCSANLIHGKAPVLFLSAIFVPSCVVIFVCYFRIFMVARHHAKAIAAVEFAVHRHIRVKFMLKDTKYAKTLALVIGVFLLLWLPYLFFIFVETVCSTRFDIWVQTYLILLTVFNSGINPWVYAFKNNELRAAFKRLFTEICRYTICRSADRRTSLMSGGSGTPRLSRADSRLASIEPEANMYTVCEKLQQSLDSLDEQMKEITRDVYDNQSRRQTIEAKVSTPPSIGYPKHSLRQAASCSDLDTAKGGDPELGEPVTRSRSFSVDLTLTGDSSGHSEADVRYVNEFHCKLPPAVDAHRQFSQGSSFTEITDHTCNKVCSIQSSVLPSNSSIISSPQVQLSPVHVHSSSSSSMQSSVLDSHSSTLSVLNHSDESQQTSLPLHTKNESTESTSSHPHQQLRHTHSLDHLQEALPPSVYWKGVYCQESLAEAAFHPYFQNFHLPAHYPSASGPVPPAQAPDPHVLTHTHSCPIFDPITSYQFIFPQITSEDMVPSPQGKVPSLLHEKRVDFVSLVHRESKHSCSDRYLV